MLCFIAYQRIAAARGFQETRQQPPCVPSEALDICDELSQRGYWDFELGRAKPLRVAATYVIGVFVYKRVRGVLSGVASARRRFS